MKPQFIDIHSHVNFTDFDSDRIDVVKRALDVGVWMINIGTGKETSQKAVEMIKEFPTGVYAIVGLHPVHTNEETFDQGFYRNLIKNGGKKVVGIGECGLDYYRFPTPEEKKKQKDAFIAQIELALELDLPLMLHIRSGVGGNAYQDVIDILKGYKKNFGEKLRGDTHFFAGTIEDAREFLALGFHLSYTGVITFAKQYKELIENTPIDKIMSETDCPYVSPVPERGKRCEPLFVIHVANKIAGIKNLDPIECQKHIIDNAFKLFKL